MNEASCCKTDRCTDDRWSQPTDDAEKDASQIGSFGWRRRNRIEASLFLFVVLSCVMVWMLA